MLSSPTPGSPRVLVQSPLAGTPRRRHLATPGSPSLIQSPIAGITPLISTKKVNRGSPRGLFTSSPRRHTTCRNGATYVCYIAGMRIRIRSDPVIFGPPDPDPVLFSTDPDPTCNNGFIKLFLSRTKYKSESTNSSIK